MPELVEPRRVSWPTLIMLIGTLIGGWALIGVLIDVSQSFDTVIGADWLWVIVALVLAQLAYVASGVETVGSVSGPLPFGRAWPSSSPTRSARWPAARRRCSPPGCGSSRAGLRRTVALSSGAIMAAGNWIAITVLSLVSLPFAWGNITSRPPRVRRRSKLVWTILAVVVLVAVPIGLLLTVPGFAGSPPTRCGPRCATSWATSPR